MTLTIGRSTGRLSKPHFLADLYDAFACLLTALAKRCDDLTFRRPLIPVAIPEVSFGGPIEGHRAGV
jgi:hypothetical protein